MSVFHTFPFFIVNAFFAVFKTIYLDFFKDRLLHQSTETIPIMYQNWVKVNSKFLKSQMWFGVVESVYSVLTLLLYGS